MSIAPDTRKILVEKTCAIQTSKRLHAVAIDRTGKSAATAINWLENDSDVCDCVLQMMNHMVRIDQWLQR